MSEDVARAVGAAGPETFTIAGKECQVRPLTIRELAEVERICIEEYKRAYIKTFSDNLDLLPETERSGIIYKATKEASAFDSSSMPSKYAYDPRRLQVTPKIKVWLEENFDGFKIDPKLPQDTIDKMSKRAVATVLEMGLMDDGLYENLVGHPPKKSRVNYFSWWVTGTLDGQLTMAWMVVRGNGVTKDEVARELSDNPLLLNEIAREVEHLSAPAVGNG